MRLTPGTRLGPYEVLATLGSGGMSEVYRARDNRLQREVAIKVVGEALAGDAGFLSRLEQEARLAGALNHPNIVAVHDVGVHDGSPYVVTELLQGETLRERLGRGPVALSQALEWAGQIAHALAAAHGHGIIHRDLKPENVFITRTGEVKLLDFGIAKATPRVTEPRGLLDPTMSPAGSATRTGAILGTPGYMSPEQVRGEPVDARSDIFALGTILYELLSGQRAFRAGSIVESGHSILHDEAAPLPSSVPLGVAQLVQNCLAKDVEARFQSARDVALSLDAVRGSGFATPTTLIPPQGVARSPAVRRAIWAALGLFLVLGAFAAEHGLSRPASQPSIRQLTFHRGAVWSARFAPDGKTVHLSAAWGSVLPELYTATVDSRVFRRMGLGPTHLLSVSPSGELAVLTHVEQAFPFGVQGTLATVPQLGGTPRELATAVFGADWAPDGTTFAVVRGGTEGNVLEYPAGHVVFRSTGFMTDPRVSGSGDRVAFLDHPRSGDTAGTVTVVGKTGKAEAWSPLFDDAFGVAWSRDGTEVLVGAALPGEIAAIWAVRPGRSPRLVYRGTGNLMVSDVARDGRLLVMERDWRQELIVAPREGTPRPVEWMDWASVAGLSDDGKQLLSFESGVGAAPNLLMVLQTLDQPAPVLLGRGRALALSGDGKWVLSSPSDLTADQLQLIPTGPGEPRSLRIPGLRRLFTADFFADGKRLALFGTLGDEEGPRVLLYDMESGQHRPISPPLAPSFRVAVSPDQRAVAIRAADGTPTVFPIDGGKADRVSELGQDQVIGWLKDGSLLSFERTAVPSKVRRFDPRTRTVTPYTTLAPPDVTGVQRLIKVLATPDGQTFAFHHRRRSDVLFLMDFGERGP